MSIITNLLRQWPPFSFAGSRSVRAPFSKGANKLTGIMDLYRLVLVLAVPWSSSTCLLCFYWIYCLRPCLSFQFWHLRSMQTMKHNVTWQYHPGRAQLHIHQSDQERHTNTYITAPERLLWSIVHCNKHCLTRYELLINRFEYVCPFDSWRHRRPLRIWSRALMFLCNTLGFFHSLYY